MELKRRDQPRDVLSVLIDQFAVDQPMDMIVATYLSFLFATIGSVGLMLGWSLFLTGQHSKWDCEPINIVTEALRLYPIAWMIDRRPLRPHDVRGEPISLKDRVVVCPYAIHRNPRHWSRPLEFHPDRWTQSADRTAWLPFGAGPNGCIAASLSLDFVSRVFQEMRDQAAWSVRPIDAGPGMGPALKPNRFLLKRLG